MILIPVFFGCDTQEDLGIKYELGSNANVKFVEFTLPASNIYLDSLRTDGENRVLVGHYQDPLTGSVTAEGYFQFFYEKGPLPREKSSDDTPNPADTLEVDSVVLILESTGVVPQRGSSFQEFTINELTDTLKTSAIYLSNLKQNIGEEVGSYSNSINVVLDTVFRVKLSDSFSQSLNNRLSDIAGDADQSIFTSSFTNLGLVAGSNSQSIASISLVSDTSRLIVYSSPVNPGIKDTTYLTYFTLVSNSGKNYTFLNRDRSGSAFDGIQEKENYDLQSNQTIIDPLSGLSTAFSLEALDDFFENNRRILINNATLSFEITAEDNRDTLINFMNYLRKEDLSIYGPAIVENAFDNIVMSDNGYLSVEVDPANGTLSDNREEILLRTTLFHQQLYRQYLESDSLVFSGPTSVSSRKVSDLVLLSPSEVTLQRTIFASDGIKLKLFYTEVEE
ncbi:DUF4270 family protein [Ekhidna sp.]|uniref:DUF4270 family protein n=1 Tax=Ekhidna sp. TaxID=2608089 RepID=UPI003CCC0FE5